MQIFLCLLQLQLAVGRKKTWIWIQNLHFMQTHGSSNLTPFRYHRTLQGNYGIPATRPNLSHHFRTPIIQELSVKVKVWMMSRTLESNCGIKHRSSNSNVSTLDIKNKHSRLTILKNTWPLNLADYNTRKKKGKKEPCT